MSGCRGWAAAFEEEGCGKEEQSERGGFGGGDGGEGDGAGGVEVGEVEGGARVGGDGGELVGGIERGVVGEELEGVTEEGGGIDGRVEFEIESAGEGGSEGRVEVDGGAPTAAFRIELELEGGGWVEGGGGMDSDVQGEVADDQEFIC